MMGAARVGGHAYIREKAVPKYAGLYGATIVDGDCLYLIEHIDHGYGRDALHLKHQSTGTTLAVWRGEVKPLPWCEYCRAEGHTGSKCGGDKK